MSSGDQCPKCKNGQMRIRTSRQIGDYQEQRLECNRCGEKHDSKVIARRTSVFGRKLVR
jgi:transcriptional regulator NrdR family protein